MVTYSIYKDEETKNTIKKIKSILKHTGIEVKEEITSEDLIKKEICPSIRITIANTEIGTNGKGTCIENAFASGYGEFMERLQTSHLVDFEFPDIRKIDIKSINKNLLGNTKIDIKEENIDAIPFYSIKDKKIVYVPQYLFDSTNGLAAGNTIEEALVQGLSEVCERYALKNIILNRISLPDIPKELYMKYDNIRNIIHYYNAKGYEIFIKDASIGKNIPAVYTIAINKKENIIIFCIASHPTLAVAIERTLTEIFQGREVTIGKDEKNNKAQYIEKDYYNKYLKDNRLALLEQLFMKSMRFENNEDLINQFISNPPSFEFFPNAWINSNEKVSNKDLLVFLINNIKPITKNEIYVRDVSFLGFPSISIYIPTMSKCVDFNASQFYAMNKWKNYKGQNDDYYDDIINLRNLLEFLSEHPFISIVLTDEFPVEYLLVLCSIILKDYDTVVKYSNILIDKFDFKRVNLFKLIRDYYSYKQNDLSDNEVNERLNNLYSSEDIKFFYRFINKLSFKVIKQILFKKQPKEADKVVVEKLNNIKENLQKIYENNIPDQMKLKEIFE